MGHWLYICWIAYIWANFSLSTRRRWGKQSLSSWSVGQNLYCHGISSGYACVAGYACVWQECVCVCVCVCVWVGGWEWQMILTLYRERLGGHKEDAWAWNVDERFWKNEVKVSQSVQHCLYKSPYIIIFYLFLFMSSYHGCSLQRYMAKHNTKHDTSAFQLVSYTSYISQTTLFATLHM